MGVLGAAAVIVLMAAVVTAVLGADMRPGVEDSNPSMSPLVTSGAIHVEEKPGL